MYPEDDALEPLGTNPHQPRIQSKFVDGRWELIRFSPFLVRPHRCPERGLQLRDAQMGGKIPQGRVSCDALYAPLPVVRGVRGGRHAPQQSDGWEGAQIRRLLRRGYADCSRRGINFANIPRDSAQLSCAYFFAGRDMMMQGATMASRMRRWLYTCRCRGKPVMCQGRARRRNRMGSRM